MPNTRTQSRSTTSSPPQHAAPPSIDIDWLRTTRRATLTRTELATLLHVDQRTVNKAIQDGEIPAVRLGRRILIPAAKIRELLGVDGQPAA